jgi:asparagine synthetase B (glutamine-hydrolysing)
MSAKTSVLSEQVRNLVQEATRLRLTADVPVGLFLSGGIDSACVLAATRQETSGKIRTFSVTFGDQKYDESPYARLLASRFETEHHEFRVTPNVMDLLPEMAALFDEPFADESAIPTYYLAKLTSEHVKVALSGDGGDEAFAGYQRYLALKLLNWLSRVPGGAHLSALRRLLPYSSTSRSKLRYMKEFLSLVGRPPTQQYKAMFLGMLDEEQWTACYTDGFRECVEKPAETDSFLQGWDLPSMPDDLARATASDNLGYIPECLNVKVDIASMACGLEVRSPFLDHKLVEFCARVPSGLKIRNTEQKYILKQAFREELPMEILKREKTGFGLPLAEWLRHDLRTLVRDTLLSPNSCISSLFRTEKVGRRHRQKSQLAGSNMVPAGARELDASEFDSWAFVELGPFVLPGVIFMPINYLHSLFHRVEDGWDPITSGYASSYTELAWNERSPKLIEDLEIRVGGFAGKRVLDLGGGPGQYSVLFAQRGADVTWHDVSREYESITRQRAAAAGVTLRFSL